MAPEAGWHSTTGSGIDEFEFFTSSFVVWYSNPKLVEFCVYFVLGLRLCLAHQKLEIKQTALR
jgi:hypothetical protein